MSDFIRLTRHEDVAVLTISNPPLNVLSPGVPEAILAALEEVRGDSSIRAVILNGAGSTFIAGADIREFSKIVAGERERLDFLPFLLTIENFPRPIIAALHGTAFGIGLETAMAAHYRVIAASAQVGQPEVKLGLIPGAAGTQRLPRLVGALKAAEMCTFGEPVSAQEAFEHGLVDRIIAGDLLAGAFAFAREFAGQPIPKTRERPVAPADLSALRDRVRKTKRNLRAPLVAVDAVEAATTLPFTEGCRRETELFYQCMFSEESKALIYAFFGERTVAKIPGLRPTGKVRQLRQAAVVGAGTMGTGIATVFANAGIPVRLMDTSAASLDRALASIRANYARSVAKGRLSEAEADRRLALLTPQSTYAGFAGADLIVEAVFEHLPAKQSVFAELDRVANETCILASNTSSLDIDAIASVTRRPQQVIGMHFFSPAPVMRLVEVVRAEATSDETITAVMALAKRLGKVAVLARNAFGFIGNRMVLPYLREAHLLLEEGASVEEINAALTDFGMAMGPLAMEDLAGLDVMCAIRQAAPPPDPAVRQPVLADLLYQAGRYGQKTGRGWSLYDGDRNARPDSAAAQLIEGVRQTRGTARRDIDQSEIVRRCLSALAEEGMKLLGEGVALRAVDIDMVYLLGYGFPAWRGGPMFYAATLRATGPVAAG